VQGGTSEAMRVRGNIVNFKLESSTLDGGRDHHVLKVLCDTETSEECTYIPEDIFIHNNSFTKTVYDGEWPSSPTTEDLIQFEGMGHNSTIDTNTFGENPGEDCIGIKSFGVTDGGGWIWIGNNEIPAEDCAGSGIQVIQPARPGSVVIEANHIYGGSSLVRNATGVNFYNNYFEAAALTIAGNTTPPDSVVANNTWSGSDNALVRGDSTGLPGPVDLINNIFDGTSFLGTGRWTDESNAQISYDLLYQATTIVRLDPCSNCITGEDPLLSDYAVASNSPAVDAGDPSWHYSTDIEGTTRPQGDAEDIGCYEVPEE
jgi:hypothetical protein